MAAPVPAESTANGLVNKELLESHTTEIEAEARVSPNEKKWPGWPGHCVFRIIVPVLRVGSIIGRKGELIKKMCEETRARVRVLDAPPGTPERVVLISGQEEPDASFSPAMDALMRVFKRVVGLSETDGNVQASEAGKAFCSIRLLVASIQASSLIGKQGSLIKSIQQNTSASVRILSADEASLFAAVDERVVELQGEAFKVLKALQAVIGHLRKFLVDQSVIPLFLKTQMAATPVSQAVVVSEYPLSIERESPMDREIQALPSSLLPIYGHDHGFPGLRSSGSSRADNPLVTQVTKTMQVPFVYAEAIIGVGGTIINYIRRTSNAVLTVEESRVSRDEITIDIKGTPEQVQVAQELIEEFVGGVHKEPRVATSFGRIEGSSRSSESQFSLASLHPHPSLLSFGGSTGLGLGGYGSFRL